MRYLNYFEWDQAPQKEETAQLDEWKRCPQHRAGRGRSLGTLRENYFLSLAILGSTGDPCELAALSSLGGSVDAPRLKEEWKGNAGDLHPGRHPGDQTAVPVCPSRSRPGERGRADAWARARRRRPASRRGSALQRAQVLFSLCWDAHHCTNGIANGMKYFQIMSAAPDIASQATAAQCSRSMGQRRKHPWPDC